MKKLTPFDRNGTAAVEASLMMPVLFFIFLGAIDVAQYINVSQVVANASREGAMIAIRHTTTDEQDVETAVFNYLAEHYPSLATNAKTLEVTVERVVEDGMTATVDDNRGNFSSAEPGDAVSVTVQFNFADVRWIPGPQYWKDRMNSQTISRKQ